MSFNNSYGEKPGKGRASWASPGAATALPAPLQASAAPATCLLLRWPHASWGGMVGRSPTPGGATTQQTGVLPTEEQEAPLPGLLAQSRGRE